MIKMKITLYDLTESYQNILELIGEDDANEELERILNQIDEQFELKADNIAKIIRTIESNNATIKQEKDRLARRQTQGETAVKRLKAYLEASMEAIGKTKFKTELFSFNIQNFKKSVRIEDPKQLPKQYLIEQAPQPDKNKIYKDLSSGIEIKGAELSTNKGLVIR